MKLKEIKLGDVLDVKRGTSLSGKYYDTTGTKIRLTLGNFNYPLGGFKNNTSKLDIYFNGPVKEKFILKKGDVITPLTEQVRGLLGETARIPDNDVYIQSGDIGLLIPNENKLDKSYMYHLISSDMIKNQLSKGAQQTKIRHTSPEKIKDCVAWIPDLNTQKQIGKFLDNIDSKIANNNAISKELESMAKTIYDYWFLQFEFPDKDGKPYKSNGGKIVWNDQLKQEIPEGWEVRKLKDIIVENPKSKIKVKEAQQDHFGDIPFFTSGQSILSMDEKLVTGMNCYLNTGGNADVKYFYGPASYSTDTWSIKGKVFMEYLLPFILKNLQPSMDDKFFQGTGLRHLQKPLLKDYPILVPNEEIISKFIPLVSDVFRKVSDSYRENIELEKMRNFLLPMLMNGQVTIKD